MKKWIAERELWFSEKGKSERKKLTIRVGVPYWAKDNMAACPVEYDGLFESYSDVYGADLLHALYLASDVDSQLSKLGESKYDFYFPGGEPYFDEV
jgi:hypothetical protein